MKDPRTMAKRGVRNRQRKAGLEQEGRNDDAQADPAAVRRKQHGNREQRDDANQANQAFHIFVRPPQIVAPCLAGFGGGASAGATRIFPR